VGRIVKKTFAISDIFLSDSFSELLANQDDVVLQDTARWIDLSYDKEYLNSFVRYDDLNCCKEDNWFSPNNVYRLKEKFSICDLDFDGMVSRSDLTKYRYYNPLVLDRIFQVSINFYGSYSGSQKGKLDFIGFCQVVLAFENWDLHFSVSYCFSVLDFKMQGKLDIEILNTYLEMNFKLAKIEVSRCQGILVFLFH
jgi:Ca2+-binding EF-hand superfamily protein